MKRIISLLDHLLREKIPVDLSKSVLAFHGDLWAEIRRRRPPLEYTPKHRLSMSMRIGEPMAGIPEPRIPVTFEDCNGVQVVNIPVSGIETVREPEPPPDKPIGPRRIR